MLSSLERFCPNKEEGCEWKGSSEQVQGHYKTCTKKSIARELEEKDILIALLKGKIAASSEKYARIEKENIFLKDENEKLLKKIQVYDAFFNHDSKATDSRDGDRSADEKMSPRHITHASPRNKSHVPDSSSANHSSDASNLAKLRNFEKKSVYL